DIKSNNLEASYLTWFKSMCIKMEHNFVELTKLKSTSQFIYKLVSSILIGFFVFFAIQLFQAQPAQLMLIVIIFSRLWPRFTGIQSNLEQLGSTIPSFNTLIILQKQCQQAKEFQTSTSNTLTVHNEISCKNVYFRYNTNAPEYALKGVSLKIKGNRTTAIVGRSGAGKSTLIDLIMGLNLPEKGEVLIDGKPLNDKTVLELRNSISYVPQDPFLFNTSIRENMILVKANAGDEQIWNALRFASAEKFVKKLPQGLDTIIGDRGIRLSGGERQRIVLARAILRNPSILVLDEATSALDVENETNIKEAIDRLKGRMTIIVIAHRLSTIRNADHVIVLDEGSIIQNGEFHQLANDGTGMFSYLLGKQMTVS
ncbi:MAG TPA: ATP-binding cassette domain-containing protein, partial [Niallia sp.]|nr:ATP-binding cassette domain-containing protein [Niallia sp.]